MASRHFDWLRQADADLRLAGHARDGAAHDWACFAAQQAAEKALKAVLMSRGADAWGHTVGIPVQTDHRFRPKPITDSGPNRSLIPAETDHRFRSKPITVGRS